MKIPRDVSGQELIRSLQKIGYAVSRQRGSHIRLSCNHPNGQHHVTIPNHSPVRIGTLSSILTDVALAHGLTREELFEKIFG